MQLSVTVAALVASAEELAQIHDELGICHPARASEYRRSAEQARTAADQTRQIGRQFSD